MQLCFTQFSILFLRVKLYYANLFIFSGWYSIYRKNYYCIFFFFFSFYTFFNSRSLKKNRLSYSLFFFCNVSSCIIFELFSQLIIYLHFPLTHSRHIFLAKGNFRQVFLLDVNTISFWYNLHIVRSWRIAPLCFKRDLYFRRRR